MRGVIYARYSPGPNQKELSIEGQVRDCKAFAKANNISVVSVYADRHLSGKSTAGRDEFLKMINDAKDGKFDCVIVWKVDRFGRDRVDIAVYKKALKDAGVKLLYAKESIPEGAEGILLEAFLEGLAEYYSVDLAQKVSRGIRDTLLKGEYCYEPPCGYTRDENRHIQIIEEYAPHLKSAFEAYAKGISNKSIIADLNEAGVRTQAGAPLSSSDFYRIVRNERYCGRCIIAGVKFDFPPIISEELFDKCQERHKMAKRDGAASAKNNYLLSKKCYCMNCGHLLAGISAKSNRFFYYKCTNKECSFSTVQKEKLEKAVLKATMENCLTNEAIDTIVKAVMDYQIENLEGAPKKKMQDKLNGVKRKISNCVNLMAETGSSALIEKLNSLEEEKKELERQIAEYDMSNNIINEKIIRNYLKLMQSKDISSDNTKKELLQHFVNRVDVSKDEAIITYNTSSIGTNRILLVDYSKIYSYQFKYNKLYIQNGIPFVIVDLS